MNAVILEVVGETQENLLCLLKGTIFPVIEIPKFSWDSLEKEVCDGGDFLVPVPGGVEEGEFLQSKAFQISLKLFLKEQYDSMDSKVLTEFIKTFSKKTGRSLEEIPRFCTNYVRNFCSHLGA